MNEEAFKVALKEFVGVPLYTGFEAPLRRAIEQYLAAAPLPTQSQLTAAIAGWEIAEKALDEAEAKLKGMRDIAAAPVSEPTFTLENMAAMQEYGRAEGAEGEREACLTIANLYHCSNCDKLFDRRENCTCYRPNWDGPITTDEIIDRIAARGAKP